MTHVLLKFIALVTFDIMELKCHTQLDESVLIMSENDTAVCYHSQNINNLLHHTFLLSHPVDRDLWKFKLLSVHGQVLVIHKEDGQFILSEIL